MKRASLASVREQPVSHNPEIVKKVLLGSEDLPPLTNFSQAVFRPGQVASGHAHADMHEVFFVRSGSGRIAIDGRDYPMRTDDCFLIEAGEHHEIRNGGSEDLVLLYFGLKTSGS